MKSWKAVLGVGAACIACCAVPLWSGFAGLAAGGTALAAGGSALLACADEFMPAVIVLLAVASAAAGVIWWRRSAATARRQLAGCGGGCDADADTSIACTLRAGELNQRLACIRRVTDRSLLHHRLDGTTLQLTYSIDAKPDLERIVAGERECCAFLRYALEAAGDVVRLTIRAPDGVGADAWWLFDHFLPGPSPSAASKGCGCVPGTCA